MDSSLSRNELFELVVDYGNTIEYEIISDNQSENELNSSESISPSSMKNDSDIYVDEEKNLITKCQNKKRKLERILFNYLSKTQDMILQENIPIKKNFMVKKQNKRMFN